MKNSFISKGLAAKPHEKFGAANVSLVREANRLALPFVFKEEKTIAHFGDTSWPIFVPVILGAAGQSDVGKQLAEHVTATLAKRDGVQTALVGVGDLAEAPAATRSALAQADAIIIIAPEHNYGYADLLKPLFEMNLPEQIRRVVGICDLSPGWFGGSRLLETLLPMMRTSGLIPIFWNENRSNLKEFFEAASAERIDAFVKELLWIATMLRQRREPLLPN